jgi:hypothetical protein
MFSPRPVPIDAGQVPAMRIAGFFISAEPAPNKGENNQRNVKMLSSVMASAHTVGGG